VARPIGLGALLTLGSVLVWSSAAAACSVTSLDRFIAEAEATSRKYWIASILVGAMVMALAHHRRWSITLAVTIAFLIFHPHLTIRAFPMPSCEFISVQASQAVLAVLAMMLGFRVMLVVRRTTARMLAPSDAPPG